MHPPIQCNSIQLLASTELLRHVAHTAATAVKKAGECASVPCHVGLDSPEVDNEEKQFSLSVQKEQTVAGEKDRREDGQARSICTPPPRSQRADRQRLIEQFKVKNPIPYWRSNSLYHRVMPNLMPDPPPSDPHLADLGITIKLDDSFPAGMKETELPNYEQVVDAFSHCFWPGLFASLNMPDPYAAFPYEQTYWDGIFKVVSPAGFRVSVVNSAGGRCLEATADVMETSGSPPVMEIYDCTSAPDIFHEIGHIIMDYGILGHIPPLYYHYATGLAGDPRVPGDRRTIDAIDELNRLFGNFSERLFDIDGVRFGFVSDYAITNKQEDFAETLKYYVYYPNDALAKAARQAAQKSTLLGEKLSYIAYLFKNMTFRYGGVVDNWPGYSL